MKQPPLVHPFLTMRADQIPGGYSVPRVYLVSDVRLYREGLAVSLSQRGGLNVIGATCSDEALTGIESLSPDVMLLDLVARNSLWMPRRARLIVPTLRVIAFAVGEVEADVLACAEAGFCGYVVRDGSIEDLVDAVHRAMSGELACSSRIAACLFSRLASLSAERPAAELRAALTPREREIAVLVARGLQNKQIARCMRLGHATIKNHVHNILQKLNLKRRSEIAAILVNISPWHVSAVPPI
jgi:two-component system nitrate/nitrite response regulator NarL